MDQNTGDTLLELQLVATLLSTVAYGLVIALVCRCLSLLWRDKLSPSPPRRRLFFIIYTLYMFFLSTAAAVQTMVFITRSIFHGVDSRLHPLMQTNEPLILPFVVWGADGLLIWRCLEFYENLSWGRRMFLKCILCFSNVVSLGNGILYYLGPQTSRFFPQLTITTINLGITTLVNCILTTLIIVRLGFQKEAMCKIFGPRFETPYIRIIIMLVESCSMIVMTSLVYLILFARGNGVDLNSSIIPLLLLPHVCVISPLLVVSKVCQQRVGAGTTLKVTSENLIPDYSNAGWANDRESFQSSGSERTLQDAYAESDIGSEVISRASTDREIGPDILLYESTWIWNVLPL
ncbi:hypothetical protein HYPSUDRAFT_960575 [Hypholoma sublateritium FD-334 SS-4]|uniref:THH1/TOM1/TOM3 domain-containing protein n=1 Tax=Hypholoma sublateritium (strain FD-334 SS-4) TaxID=945553 RepID=A0A0D2NH87_HYPSF|nr:hypothetical protein HYPSUDRAFT_960575 [Hypholoma sublateritium FD-334 SS-4]